MICCLSLLLLGWSDEYRFEIAAYNLLYQRMFTEGWLSYSETGEVTAHEDFMAWDRSEEYVLISDRMVQCSLQFLQYSRADEVPESLIEEYTQALRDMNGCLMDFMGLEEVETEAVASDIAQYPLEDEVDRSSLVTANIVLEGDAPAVDRLRFGVQNIQGLYDTISQHLDKGEYSLARRNIDNLENSLSSLGAEIIELRNRHSVTVTVLGLPSDEAMIAHRELLEEKEKNYRLWEYAQTTVQDLDRAVMESDLTYLTAVWRTACQSMMDWHSPPDWYEVPQVFYQWYQQSEEASGVIQEAMNAMHMLRVARNELDRIRTTALETHSRLLEREQAAEPLVEMDCHLRELLMGLDWAEFTER